MTERHRNITILVIFSLPDKTTPDNLSRKADIKWIISLKANLFLTFVFYYKSCFLVMLSNAKHNNNF